MDPDPACRSQSASRFPNQEPVGETRYRRSLACVERARRLGEKVLFVVTGVGTFSQIFGLFLYFIGL
jgi:hypothetical protein